MLSPFICGSGNFHDDDDEEPCTTTPKRSSRKNSFCRRHSSKNSSKNPYSSRGLDKFSALVADLDEKRQRIYSQLGPQETPLVRFVYRSSDDCVPIVVRLKKDQEKIKKGRAKKEDDQETPQTAQEVKKEARPEREPKRVVEKGFSWSSELRRPACYLPAAVILILVFLAVFGRSAAVMCTSVGWYLVPALQGERSNAKRSSMKKREYKKTVVKSLCSSPTGASTPQHSGGRKSF